MPPVRISRTGQVIDRVAKVRKAMNEDVRWIATEGGGPWTITFGKDSDEPSTYPLHPGSPFDGTTYVVGPGGSGTSSGSPLSTTPVKATYRYKVSDSNGRVTDDPDVDIE